MLTCLESKAVFGLTGVGHINFRLVVILWMLFSLFPPTVLTLAGVRLLMGTVGPAAVCCDAFGKTKLALSGQNIYRMNQRKQWVVHSSTTITPGMRSTTVHIPHSHQKEAELHWCRMGWLVDKPFYWIVLTFLNNCNNPITEIFAYWCLRLFYKQCKQQNFILSC